MVNNTGSPSYFHFDEGFKPADQTELKKYTEIKDVLVGFNGIGGFHGTYSVDIDKKLEIKVGHIKQLIYQKYNISLEKKISIICHNKLLNDNDSFWQTWSKNDIMFIA